MDKSKVKLFVGGLPADIDEIELVQLIAIHGDVLTIKIVRDRATKKCKGYAFLEMANLEAAENVIKSLDGEVMGKNNLSFNIVKENPATTLVDQPLPKKIQAYKKVTNDAALGKKKRPRK